MLSVHSNEDSSYICDGCGEEIVIPLDISEGASQSYVEDCPVCCRANLIHVDWSTTASVPESGPSLNKTAIKRCNMLLSRRPLQVDAGRNKWLWKQLRHCVPGTLYSSLLHGPLANFRSF